MCLGFYRDSVKSNFFDYLCIATIRCMSIKRCESFIMGNCRVKRNGMKTKTETETATATTSIETNTTCANVNTASISVNTTCANAASINANAASVNANKIPNELYERILNEMADFVAKHSHDIGRDNSGIIVSEFDANHDRWFQVVPYMSDCKLYAECLIKYLEAMDVSPNYDRLSKASLYADEFEKYKLSEHKYRIEVFRGLGIAWHHLGTPYDTFAIAAFKKYIFYLLGMSSVNSYSPVCYSFRKCTTYLYQALVNEQINVSSPVTFNDPFDSPVIALLDNDDEISKLIRTAYLSCVKIACFVCNVMLPFDKDPNNPLGDIVYDKKKHEDDVPEFQNELMWAHYADYHRGVCIKYHFPNDFTKLYSEINVPVRYFRDVEYKDDLSALNVSNSISIKDAFFAKGKAWGYENELRLLQCDLSGKGDYDVIDVPNCIEAVYFGVKCSDKDVDTIMKIMEGRELVTETFRWQNGKRETVTDRKPVQFYRMEFDRNRFGALKAVQIYQDMART